MKVSVIIPTYNEESVISDCLLSLLQQDHRDFEIIVVDDGSSDKTIQKVNNVIAQNKSLISLYKKEHKGPGSARNLGAQKSKGKILVFVDSDMTFDKQFLAELIKPILDGKSKGTFSKEEYVSNWENIWSKCWNINQGWVEKRRHPRNYPDQQKVFRAILKSEFERVGGFDKGGHYTDDYLSDKLGYQATAVRGAKFYHSNPEQLREIYYQAKWASKREYKFGKVGGVYALLRSSLPFSLVIGTYKSIINLVPAFLIFKIVYDIGVFVGVFQFVLLNQSGGK